MRVRAAKADGVDVNTRPMASRSSMGPGSIGEEQPAHGQAMVASQSRRYGRAVAR